jgi:D-glycerate 3-kinase
MFYDGHMFDQCIPTAETWLRENTNLGSHQRKAMSALCPALIEALPVAVNPASPILVSIGGAPGSGKSTLARMLSAVLVKAGRRCQLLSLDDYYLPLAERQALAGLIHPLCVVRGVPGTHDLPLLLDHLERLIQGDIAYLAMPQFDKASDDRLQNTQPCAFEAPLDYILLEGWMCGAQPQSTEALSDPFNRLEAVRGAGQVWRQWVNLNLQEYHHTVDRRMDGHWYMQAPGWDSIVDWRWQQEQELSVPALKSRTDVEAFLAHYQRLVEHMQETSGNWADLILLLDASHCATIS